MCVLCLRFWQIKRQEGDQRGKKGVKNARGGRLKSVYNRGCKTLVGKEKEKKSKEKVWEQPRRGADAVRTHGKEKKKGRKRKAQDQVPCSCRRVGDLWRGKVG